MAAQATATAALKSKDYKSEVHPTWCPGCGDFGLLSALYQGMAQAGLDFNRTALVSGIGCSSRIPFFVKTYGFHGCHGRALPTALGLKTARPDLDVVVAGGDGDGFSIGAGHVPHVARKNVDLLYLVMDNRIYGLTKGQVSPTSRIGFVTTTTPYGSQEDPVDPAVFAIVYGATFVARGFSADRNHLADLITRGIRHKGFAIIDVVSPCPIFNKDDTFDYYKPLVSKLDDSSHDPGDKKKALELALSIHNGGSLPIGVYYQRQAPTLGERMEGLKKANKGSGTPNLDAILDVFKV